MDEEFLEGCYPGIMALVQEQIVTAGYKKSKFVTSKIKYDDGGVDPCSYIETIFNVGSKDSYCVITIMYSTMYFLGKEILSLQVDGCYMRDVADLKKERLI